MEKSRLDGKITEASKTILSYCMARTSSQYDAEECVLPEELPDSGADPAQVLEEDSDLCLLRRELALLAEKYRQAAVLYYLEEQSCAQIARKISVSESMVKYLLFKSRQIVKEGMSMERKLGEQSYNPRRLGLGFWGGVNRYGDICDSLISQNILYACYNDRLTAEQISLEMGVALPYMEGNLAQLLEYGLLHRDGNYYSTDLVIFTREFGREADRKTQVYGRQIADRLRAALEEKESDIRAIDFCGADMDENIIRWQTACILLGRAVLEDIELDYPVDKFGEKCFVWGYECYEKSGTSGAFGMGNCMVCNDRGDELRFKDFAVNGEKLHKLFFRRREFANVLLDVADGRAAGLCGTDRAVLAELVKRGIVIKDGEKLRPNLPVFTRGQLERLEGVLREASEEITALARKNIAEAAGILRNHVPFRLKKNAEKLAYFRVFDDCISKPMELLYREKFLRPVQPGEPLPTTFVLLNR